ncbi:MAG: endonuclease MutS2 [Lachnospiraceae bacterium]|jgi:DNA mismatch repair protein MutS2|nr:endonuclease MutS2 [Lachnospiraceae bacterium]
MEKKTLEKLEYNKIIDMLVDKASSDLGKSICKSLLPSTDLEEIQVYQLETKAAFDRLVKKGNPGFTNFKSVGESIKRLDIGASLIDTELLNIAKILRIASAVKSYGKHETVEEKADILDNYFEGLDGVPSVEREISTAILGPGEISDDASGTLKSIRRSINGMSDKIHSTLNQMINGSIRSYLQDAIVSMRGDRYVIPVKAEYKSKVPGLLHDQSSTGSTLFIEPAAVVRLNNELKELHIKEKEEIEKILAQLSNKCGEITDILKLDEDLLSHLDFVFAKGNLAIDMNGSLPIFNKDHRINIRNGRHPLLNKKTVVPISINLGKDFDLLIITGPNTGGKTVSLKTVGLFTLMGQAGLHIPALDRSELSVFANVYADIGDEQSIEQSLSTFSSHMTNIVNFLSKVTSDDLVLFDELGAGTDPVEGAALAISILESLHNRGIRTMATTHYSELKVFALTTAGVENASCEFDVNSLRPTYRLLIGVPGKSNAFAIAKRLGMSDDIVNQAKEHIGEQDESLEDLMTELELKRVAFIKEQEEWDKRRLEYQKKERQAADKYNSLDRQRERILSEAKAEAKKILSDAKDTADDTIKLFNKAKSDNVTIQSLEEAREKLRNEIKNASKTNSKAITKPKKAYKPSDFKVGTNVKVLSMNLNGTVHKEPDSKNMVEVQMGILKTKFPINDLEILPDNSDFTLKREKKRNTSSKGMGKSLSVRPEINVIGKNVDDAIAILDKYLDDAYMAHLSPVRIVHGKGTGALRNGIHNYLKHLSYVKSFKLGEYGEGDAGVTIVEF